MDNYEKWSAKPAPKSYQLNYTGVATGYLNGAVTTVTVQLYATSLEAAMRIFGTNLGKAGLVNLSDYHVSRNR
jgi:hypothetical protein